MWHWHGGWGTGDWFTMALMMLLVWVPVIVLVLLLVRSFASRPPESGDGADAAEEEARRAYARGDIEREQFLQIVEDLRRDRPRR